MFRLDREAFARQGFVRLPAFAEQATCDRMLDRVVEIARERATGLVTDFVTVRS